jgi:hypothetical protein
LPPALRGQALAVTVMGFLAQVSAGGLEDAPALEGAQDPASRRRGRATAARPIRQAPRKTRRCMGLDLPGRAGRAKAPPPPGHFTRRSTAAKKPSVSCALRREAQVGAVAQRERPLLARRSP